MDAYAFSADVHAYEDQELMVVDHGNRQDSDEVPLTSDGDHDGDYGTLRSEAAEIAYFDADVGIRAGASVYAGDRDGGEVELVARLSGDSASTSGTGDGGGSYDGDGDQDVVSAVTLFKAISDAPWTGRHLRLYCLSGAGLWAAGSNAVVNGYIGDAAIRLYGADKADAASIKTFYFVGWFFGAIFAGMLSDRHGRKPVIVGGLAIGVLSTVPLCFGHTLWVWSILRLISGAAYGGSGIVSYTHVTEHLPRRWRSHALTMWHSSFAFGMMYTVLTHRIAVFIGGDIVEPWIIVVLLACVPLALPPFLYSFWARESPRFLATKRRDLEGARTSLAHLFVSKRYPHLVALAHTCTLPRQSHLPRDQPQKGFSKILADFQEDSQLFRGKMRKTTIILLSAWFVCTLLFYGLMYATESLGGDLGLSINAVLELSSLFVFVCLVNTKLLGRQRTAAISIGFAGLGSCVAAIPGVSNFMQQAVIQVSRFSISGSFAVIYIYTAELYPTLLRSRGAGLCSTFGRVAGIIAPTLVGRGPGWLEASLAIFGVCGIACGAGILLLHETRDQRLA